MSSLEYHLSLFLLFARQRPVHDWSRMLEEFVLWPVRPVPVRSCPTILRQREKTGFQKPCLLWVSSRLRMIHVNSLHCGREWERWWTLSDKVSNLIVFLSWRERIRKFYFFLPFWVIYACLLISWKIDCECLY